MARVAFTCATSTRRQGCYPKRSGSYDKLIDGPYNSPFVLDVIGSYALHVAVWLVRVRFDAVSNDDLFELVDAALAADYTRVRRVGSKIAGKLDDEDAARTLRT